MTTRCICHAEARSIRFSVLVVVCLVLSGCRSEKPLPPETSGYVRLEALTGLHPAWNDVRQLDLLLEHARTLKPTVAGTAPSRPDIPFPAPLVPPASRAVDHSAIERQRIQSVQAPAEARVRSLRNTLEADAERAVSSEATRLSHERDAAIVKDEQRIKQEIDLARFRIEHDSDKKLTDLGLKRIALQSKVEAYTSPLYPPEPRQKAEKDLAAVVQDIQTEEARRAEALSALDKRRESELKEARSRRESEMQASLQAFRRKELQSADSKVRASMTQVGFVVGSLGPLKPLEIPAAAPTKPLPLISPAALAQETAAVSPNPLPANSRSQRLLEAQRQRLVEYVREDLKRRITRLAAERRWKIAFAPSGGTDMTETVSGILRSEWNP